MNFYYEEVVFIINKLQIIIWYHINLFINLYNPQVNISNFLDKYIYRIIILYIVKQASNSWACSQIYYPVWAWLVQ